MAKILSIEDSAFERKVISKVLRDTKHELILAKNGKEGLKKLEEEKPDLLLLDLRLPDIDGIDILKEIKSKDLNVVIVSIIREEKTKEETMKLGAKKYISKPITKDKLLPTIDEVLGDL